MSVYPIQGPAHYFTDESSGFSGETAGKKCVGTPEGLASDPLARLLGCPDCKGMAALEPGPYKTLCYWIRRPMGQIALLLIIGGLIYLIMKRQS